MRGRRPLGYGFVSFETPEEAEKAAKELDKKDFNGRDVNVEIAKPRTSVNGATKPRPHTKRRTRRGAKEADGAAEQDDDQVVIDDKENVDGAKDSEQPAKLKNKKKKQAQRKTDQPARIDLAEEQGEPSKTTLFVGNLPFTTDDDGLKDILKNYRVKSAHVVKRKTGRSKGFGFVEMEDEAEQQKVLEEMKTVTVDGREVSIKVSVSVPHTASDGVEHSEDAPQEAET
ncbi:hypothetical protein NQZ79_g1011 [Umbelopsis isabellina]|nr:hypothetical protein NQZ79_g1011 [Umbelopsis isabellina]